MNEYSQGEVSSMDMRRHLLDEHKLYRVRVRETTYLWGSAGIKNNASFPSPLILHVHNDPAGQPISISTQTADGTVTLLGTLQPGELFSISIQNISGVFGSQTAFESDVNCVIK